MDAQSQEDAAEKKDPFSKQMKRHLGKQKGICK
jgi:hypothetical protein